MDDELRERSEAALLAGRPGPGKPGLCFDCDCMYDEPRVVVCDDDPDSGDFFCPHCGSQVAGRWPLNPAR